MEGELKIQQLAAMYRLSVQVTYLPFAPSSKAPEKEKEVSRKKVSATERPAVSRSKKEMRVIQILKAIPAITAAVSVEGPTLGLAVASSEPLSKTIGQKRKAASEKALPPPPAETSDEETNKRRGPAACSPPSAEKSRAETCAPPPPEPKPSGKLFQSAVCFMNRARKKSPPS
jgi:hypothetical protein